jgi:hypothetical protein
MFPADHYIEIEFSQTGERAGRVHGRIIRIEGPEMVIDGHLARHPTKVWHTLWLNGHTKRPARRRAGLLPPAWPRPCYSMPATAPGVMT